METNKSRLSKGEFKSFLKLLDFLNEGIIVIDKNQKISYLNKYAENILNLRYEDVENKHFSEVIKDNYLYSIISHNYSQDAKEEIILETFKIISIFFTKVKV